MKILTGLTIAIVMVAVCSCRSTKTIQSAISKKDSTRLVVTDSTSRTDSIKFIQNVYQALDKNRIDFETFSAKVKVDFEGSDGKKNDFNAFIRLRKDSVLWVSINALLGIEAFRILITPDSVKMLNKLDKVAQVRSLSYLQEVTQLPFDFYTLQELIVGNPVYLDSNVISFKKEENAISLTSIGDIFKHFITISNDD